MRGERIHAAHDAGGGKGYQSLAYRQAVLGRSWRLSWRQSAAAVDTVAVAVFISSASIAARSVPTLTAAR